MKYLLILLFISTDVKAQTKIVVPYCDTCEVLWLNDGDMRWTGDTAWLFHVQHSLQNTHNPYIYPPDTIYVPHTLLKVDTAKDYGINVGFTLSSYDAPNYVEQRITETDTVITVVGDSLNAIKLLFKAWNDLLISHQQQDSIKYYWKKYNYFKKAMGDLVDKMNESGAVFDRQIFRLEDSAKKYKLLLDRIKK